jgi:hypothetical protein
MKSVKLKTYRINNYGRTTLDYPRSPLGNIQDTSVRVLQIHDVPEHVEPQDVVRLYEATVDISHLGRQCGHHEISFTELGPGKVIRYKIPAPQALPALQSRNNKEL